jgi:hypothetical protein
MICEMQVEDFYVSIRKIIPEFDGEATEHVDVHSPAGGIVFHIIAKL